MADSKDNAALDLVSKVLALGIEGKAPGMKSSVELAEEYVRDRRFRCDDDRIDSLIRWQVGRTATSGFVTGLGGLVTMPVTVPAGLMVSWIVQARLVGSIAHLRRYDLEDDRVRTLAMAAIVGDATVTETTKRMGGQIATKSAQAAVNRVPGRVLIEINKKIGFRLSRRQAARE